MTKKLERELLIDTIKKALQLNINNCIFLKEMNKEHKEVLETLDKSIEQSLKAFDLLKDIEHLEILRAIYNDYVNKIASHLLMGGALVCSPKIQEWDKSEIGFREFTIANKEALKIAKQKAKEQEENRLAIEKAKEEGKKISMVYDPQTKQLKPVIDNESNKA